MAPHHASTDGKRLHRLEVDPIAAPVVRRIFDEYTNGAWSKSAMRAILANPRYTGFEVWNKQRRDEVLLDIDDVAQGHATKMRWNDKSAWIFSESLAHEPIIDREAFDRRASEDHLRA